MASEKIVIFEDEGVTALHLENTLNRAGYEVAAVEESADQVEDLIRSTEPDLVLMDIRLRGVVDGVDAARLVRENFGIPVVIVTAHNDQATRRRIESSGAHGVVLKPFEEREIVVAVQSALRRHRLEQALAPAGTDSAPSLATFGECVVATDAEARIVYMNGNAEQLTGWENIDAFEMEASEVIRLNRADDGELIAHPVLTVLNRPDTLRNEPDAILTSRLGPQVPVSHQVSPVMSEAGEILGAIVTIRRRLDAPEPDLSPAAARRDSSIGPMNRLDLLEALRDAVVRARGRHQMVAVFCIEIRNMEAMVEAFGSQTGDRLLAAVAARLQSFVRSSDLVARVGYSRFALVLIDVDRTNSVVTVGDKLLRELSGAFEIDANQLAIAPFVGVALFPLDTSIPTRLLEFAERAARQAGGAGRDRCAFHSQDPESAAAVEQSLGEELSTALADGRLELLFRPVHDLSKQTVVSAQMRPFWRHSDRGAIPGSIFLPVADRRGELPAITDWMLAEGLVRAASWQPVCAGARIAIRLATSELRNPGLVPRLLRIAESRGLEPELLEFEVCEADLVARPTRTSQLNMQRLRQLGVRLTVCNFGATYASMISLRKLPVHRVKIDRTLVAAAAFEPEANAIVRATIELARSCGLEIAADGVETEAQWRWLRYHGCEFGQGEYWGPPLTATKLFDTMVGQSR